MRDDNSTADGPQAPSAPRPKRRRRLSAGRTVAAALPIGMVLSGAMVWQASSAAFTATTAAPNSTWATGSVALTNSQSTANVAMNLSDMVPGKIYSRCVRVNYGGSVVGTTNLHPIKFHTTWTSAGASDVAPWLFVRVERLAPTAGSGAGSGDAADCSTFPAGTATMVYPTTQSTPTNNWNPTDATWASNNSALTLDAFKSTFTAASPLDTTWTPAANPESMAYRISVSVKDTDSAQSKSNIITLHWSAASK
ncbi:hypothetical protein NUM3379_41810 [Kineococcus sp. NUM-3379]